jgi:hypothetical protein
LLLSNFVSILSHKIKNIAEFSTYMSPLKTRIKYRIVLKKILFAVPYKKFINKNNILSLKHTAREIKIVSGATDSFKNFARNLWLLFQINQEDLVLIQKRTPFYNSVQSCRYYRGSMVAH